MSGVVGAKWKCGRVGRTEVVLTQNHQVLQALCGSAEAQGWQDPLLISSVTFWYRGDVKILHNEVNCSNEFAHLKRTLLALLNSVLINSHNKFNLKFNLHSNRLMPPSTSELMYKLSAITRFRRVALGSWLLVVLQTKQPSPVTPTVLSHRICSPLYWCTGGRAFCRTNSSSNIRGSRFFHSDTAYVSLCW